MSRTDSQQAKPKAHGKPQAFRATAARPHHDEAVATEMSRNAFSRERYEFLLRTLFAVLGVLAYLASYFPMVSRVLPNGD